MRVTRVTPDGDEIVEASLPAVVTVSNELGTPRYPTAARKIQARRIKPTGRDGGRSRSRRGGPRAEDARDPPIRAARAGPLRVHPGRRPPRPRRRSWTDSRRTGDSDVGGARLHLGRERGRARAGRRGDAHARPRARGRARRGARAARARADAAQRRGGRGPPRRDRARSRRATRSSRAASPTRSSRRSRSSAARVRRASCSSRRPSTRAWWRRGSPAGSAPRSS